MTDDYAESVGSVAKKDHLWTCQHRLRLRDGKGKKGERMPASWLRRHMLLVHLALQVDTDVHNLILAGPHFLLRGQD
jgi:hypothetical protein